MTQNFALCLFGLNDVKSTFGSGIGFARGFGFRIIQDGNIEFSIGE
jgi:hypothetical protein